MSSATDNTTPSPVSSPATGDKAVLIVAGPTASGKSALAMDVAAQFNGVVINADSMQVYSELNILSARPSEEDERRVPHRLYGVFPPSRSCSVAQWLEMATKEVEAAFAAGRLPVVTGGTGMYLRALMHGLAPIPTVPDVIRAEVQQKLDATGPQALHDELSEIDPETAARLAPGDSQRLIRAVEVFRATQRPLSQWLADGNRGALDDARFGVLVLMPPRAELYARIDARFEQMVEHGGLDEVRAIMELGLDPGLSAMKAVGVRELAAYLSGEITREEAVAKAQQASRNYAKRQMTWFRNQIREAETIFAQYSESQRSKIFSFVRQFVLTDGF